ncbi:MAG: DUF1822 family protein [Spirirestis rafaelensis WJT71-NPBG6]|jgi:hypothetical protein|nr:DUF1822 family protein [Spirirestis rafaelensis WJT71-NPBG6]
MRQPESLTFTVPISSELHSLAEQFRSQHKNPKKAKQIYLNTLAVSAVDFYLHCMGVETSFSASFSYNPVMQTMMDVADLEVIGLGKLECRPVLSDKKVVYIPPEVWSDRIGYVAVQFDESLRVATLLGFSKTAQSGEIPINQLRSLEEFILQLSEIPQKVKQKTHLSQWLINVVDAGWQTVESLLTQQSELAFRFRSAEQTLAQNPENTSTNVQKGTLLDFGGESSSKPIALIVGLIPIFEQEINIYVKVCPTDSQKYLPEELELMVLDEKGTAVMQAIARTTKSIQLNFSSQFGENFSIKVALGDVSFTEVFLV